MKLFKLFIVVFMILPASGLLAQHWYDQEMIFGENANFHAIQNRFYDYWKERDSTEKGKGWKQFKRWEWFWHQRVDAEGNFPEPGLIYRELDKLKKKNRKVKSKSDELQSAGSWESLGPITNAGGYGGLGRINAVVEHPGDSARIWIGAASGGLWKTTNTGSTWTNISDEFSSLGITDIAIDPDNDNVIYIATGDGDGMDIYSAGVLKSTDGGASWSATGLSYNQSDTRYINRLIMHPQNHDTLYACGNLGVYMTTNGGTSWSQKSTVTFRDMEMKPGAPDTLYASGTKMYRSVDAGQNWTEIGTGTLPSSGISRIAIAVTPANSNYIYALYAQSSNQGFHSFYRSTDGGDSWTLMANSPNLLGWQANGSDTSGQGWYDLCLAASADDADVVWSGGVNVWKTTNGGSDWSISTMWYSYPGIANVHADHHTLYISPWSNRLYSGHDGAIDYSTDGGDSWNWIGSGLVISQIYKIGVGPNGSGLVLAGLQDNGTKLMNSSVWSDVIGGDGMECAIDQSNPQVMYGTLYYGDFRKSTNGGTSFLNITDPNDLGAWVTPFEIHPENSNILITGFRDVWKSTNSGSSWFKLYDKSSNVTLRVLRISKADPDIIYTSEPNIIYKTTDGGSNWTTVTSPWGSGYITDICIHPDNPDTLWIAYSGYNSSHKVYRSNDGGSNWTNVTGSNLPNVPINTVIYQPDSDDRIYAGTDLGAFYLDNQVSDWQDFNEGLPNVIVNELEISEVDNKIVAATYGRGLWRGDLVLTRPMLVHPADSAYQIPLSGVSFLWNKVDSATSYTLQVSEDYTFSGYALNQSNITDTTYNSGTLDAGKRYFWRVKFHTSSYNSSWSNIRTFSMPLPQVTLVQPADSSEIMGFYDFKWNNISAADNYLVVMGPDTSASASVDSVFAADSVLVPMDLIASNSYYWKVRALNPGDTSAWSEWRYFTVDEYCKLGYEYCDEHITRVQFNTIDNDTDCGLAMGYSDYTSISTELMIDSTYPITVTNGLAYTGDLSKVFIDWNQDGDFSDSGEGITLGGGASVFNGNITVPQTALPGETRMRVFLSYFYPDSCGFQTNGYGEAEDYTVVVKMNPPDIDYPADNDSMITTSPVIKWHPAAMATSYDIQVSSEVTFSSFVMDSSSVPDTLLSLSGLSNDTHYFVRLRSVRNDKQSGWSDVFTFKTGNIEAPELLMPANGADSVSTYANFTWTEVDTADFYDLMISTDVSFSSNNILVENVMDTLCVIDTLSQGTQFYWKVRSGNPYYTGDWSDAFSFETFEDNIPASWEYTETNNYAEIQISPDTLVENLGRQPKLGDAFGAFYNDGGTLKCAGYTIWTGGLLDFRVYGDNSGTAEKDGFAANEDYRFKFWNAREASEYPAVANFISGNDYYTDSGYSTIDSIFLMKAPELLYPADSASLVQLDTSLSWQVLPGADSYRVLLSETDTFAAAIIDTTLEGTGKQLHSLDNLSLYFWKVRAEGSAESSDWSPARSFISEPVSTPQAWQNTGSGTDTALVTIPAGINPFIGTRPMVEGDAVGIFFTDGGDLKTAAYAVWDSTNGLTFKVYKDDPVTTEKDGFNVGEDYRFRVWDGALGVEYPATAAYASGPDNYMSDSVSVLSGFDVHVKDTLGLELPSGWSMISSFVVPDSADLDNLLAGLSSNIVIMKNGAGDVYWPSFGFNQIGEWNILHGYQIYMSGLDTLEFIGKEINPQDTSNVLSQGWNLIAYLKADTMDASQALGSITTNLVIAKNGAGDVYWPAFGLNDIGAMEPGEGYYIYMSAIDTLIYPVTVSTVKQSHGDDMISGVFDTEYIQPAVSLTGSNMTAIIDASGLEDGYEIAATDASGNIIGAAKVYNSTALISIWGDNTMTDRKDGAAENETIRLFAYDVDNARRYEIKAANIRNIDGRELDGLIYGTNMIISLNIERDGIARREFRIVPNPARDEINIEYNSDAQGNISLSVNDSRGKQLIIRNDRSGGGSHNWNLDISGLPQGAYTISIRQDGKIFSDKLIITR
ncbi:MAG: VPS10 domain-containing protein [Candidatus Kapaibacterium sp.]